MTNKMPVVGKRYRATEANEFIPNKNYIMRCDEIWSDRVILNKDKDGSHFSYPIEDFFDCFEELPKDNLHKENETKEGAKIDMKEECVDPVSIWKNVSDLPKVPTDCFVKTKPNTSLGVCFGVFQSTNTDNRMFSTGEGRSISKEQTDKYCTLTDFVNAFDQMQKDIEELKKINLK